MIGNHFFKSSQKIRTFLNQFLPSHPLQLICNKKNQEIPFLAWEFPTIYMIRVGDLYLQLNAILFSKSNQFPKKSTILHLHI